MGTTKNLIGIFIILLACNRSAAVFAQGPPPKRIVIAADTLFDGKGNVLRNTRIVIEGSKIVAIDPKAVRLITIFMG